MQTWTFPYTYFQNAKAVELLNETAKASLEYSSKVFSRQLEIVRKLADQNPLFSGKNFSTENFFKLPDGDVAGFEKAAQEYRDMLSNVVSDFAQATEKSHDIMERALTQAVEDGKAILPKEASDLSLQVSENFKAANTVVKEGINTSCEAAQAGLKSKMMTGTRNSRKR